MSEVLGIFDDRDRLLQAFVATRAGRLPVVTAFAPAFDRKLVEAMAPARSRVPWCALAGAIVGGTGALGFTIWTTAQWPELVVGGKPLLSMPPYLIITFELTILFGALGAFGGFVWWSIRSRAPDPALYDPRFTDGHFGLCVSCSPRNVDQAVRLLKEHGAVECRVV